jgi:hypothetical protein
VRLVLLDDVRVRFELEDASLSEQTVMTIPSLFVAETASSLIRCRMLSRLMLRANSCHGQTVLREWNKSIATR